MFTPPDYPPSVPSSLPVMWSVPMQASQEETVRIWNEAIKAAMIHLYEAGLTTEYVAPLKELLK
jgi:hypothetical protein